MTDSTMPDDKMTATPLWTPTAEQVAAARIWPLLDLVNQRYDAELPRHYGALQRWSIEYPGEFWAAVWDSCAVPGERGERLLARDTRLVTARFETTRFLPDARLNVAQALLAPWSAGSAHSGGAHSGGTGPAITFTSEDDESLVWTGPQLRAVVGRLQGALREAGVGAGDRVAAVVSNRPEGYALMIATASLGAVFTSVSPDFGADGILDRFAQVEPVVLVGVARYAYNGREHDIRATLAAVGERLPGLRARVLLGGDESAGLAGWLGWAEFLAPHPGTDPTFEWFGFDQPWYVLYSSGTTGRPKCIVHRAGGVLLKHLAEHRFQHDLGPADRLCFFTTAGWMMWNWQASALASGTGLVLYDGSPFVPTGARLFDLADAHRVTALGVSPRFLETAQQAGLRPAADHDLTALRLLLTTGSPLSAETARYVYDSVVRPAVQLAPISGGTDLCGVLVGAEPTSPVYAGQMQAAALGVAAEVVDDDAKPLPAGERGELVVRVPFPSMPLRFWGDEDGSRYHAAYFERFPGLWQHGDFAERTVQGGFVITGRSDATLNPGGVRIGTAEIYRQVAAIDGVLESAAIGHQVGHGGSTGSDSRIVLFVQLRPGLELDDELIGRIKQRIRVNLSPRHVPARVIQAPDLPRTRSGKLSELAVRDVVHHRPVTNTGALANPESLAFFETVTLD